MCRLALCLFYQGSSRRVKAFPRLNAEIQGNEMVLKHYYDIGIAVGVEEGLVVPVLRDADRKSFAEIEQEIAALAKKAREQYARIDRTARWDIYDYQRRRIWLVALNAYLECATGGYLGYAQDRAATRCRQWPDRYSPDDVCRTLL